MVPDMYDAYLGAVATASAALIGLLFADAAQHERQGDQALLDAIVQIAFDPAPRLVAHGEDPAAGGGQLGELA